MLIAYMLQGRILLVVHDQNLDCGDRFFVLINLKKKKFTPLASRIGGGAEHRRAVERAGDDDGGSGSMWQPLVTGHRR